MNAHTKIDPLDIDDPTTLAIDMWNKVVELEKQLGGGSLRDMFGWSQPKSIPLVTEPTKGPLYKVATKRATDLISDMNKAAQAADDAFGVYDYLSILEKLTVPPGALPAKQHFLDELEQFGGDPVWWRLHASAFVYGGIKNGKVLPGSDRRVDEVKMARGSPMHSTHWPIVIIRFPDASHRVAWEICR